MWVTLTLGVVFVVLLPVATAFSVSGYRKTDDALKSLPNVFKFD
jgi:hypothetical protein